MLLQITLDDTLEEPVLLFSNDFIRSSSMSTEGFLSWSFVVLFAPPGIELLQPLEIFDYLPFMIIIAFLTIFMNHYPTDCSVLVTLWIWGTQGN